jgi:gluconolactonase
MHHALSAMLESSTVERVATGFSFTEGRLWHQDGFLNFVDLHRRQLLRWQPGKGVEVVRANTGEGDGLTFDRQGRLIMTREERTAGAQVAATSWAVGRWQPPGSRPDAPGA